MKETMNLPDRRRICAFAATLFASLLLAMFAAGAARANVNPFANAFAVSPPPTTIAGCKQLPLSQWEFCMSRVGWSQLPPAHVAVNQQASAATKAEMARCKSLPYSDTFVCQEQAGYGEKVPQGHAANQRLALRDPNAEYKAAIAACKRMPVSDWTTCFSQAGYDPRLARAEG